MCLEANTGRVWWLSVLNPRPLTGLEHSPISPKARIQANEGYAAVGAADFPAVIFVLDQKGRHLWGGVLSQRAVESHASELTLSRSRMEWGEMGCVHRGILTPPIIEN